MDDRRQRLLGLIEQAFQGVNLGNGVSLHQTIVLDEYGSQAEQDAARSTDEQHDWRKLIDDPEFARINYYGGFSFYDAAGMRFHLPAYLSVVVKDPNCETRWNLQSHLADLDVVDDNRFSLLDADQKRCVWEVLIFLRDEHKATLDAFDEETRNWYVPAHADVTAALELAIEETWNPNRTDR